MSDAASGPMSFSVTPPPWSDEEPTPEPGPLPGGPTPPSPDPTVPEPPAPPPQPQPAPPEVPTPPDVATPPADPAAHAPSLPHTGDAHVDEALEQLAGLGSRTVEEQVDVYVGVHRMLQDRLADLDG